MALPHGCWCGQWDSFLPWAGEEKQLTSPILLELNLNCKCDALHYNQLFPCSELP